MPPERSCTRIYRILVNCYQTVSFIYHATPESNEAKTLMLPLLMYKEILQDLACNNLNRI